MLTRPEAVDGTRVIGYLFLTQEYLQSRKAAFEKLANVRIQQKVSADSKGWSAGIELPILLRVYHDRGTSSAVKNIICPKLFQWLVIMNQS